MCYVFLIIILCMCFTYLSLCVCFSPFLLLPDILVNKDIHKLQLDGRNGTASV